jgi:hypothetical protein
MLKIQIKSTSWTVLFEHESEDNTILKTLQDSNLQRANLQWANLQGANLQGADLQDSNLQWANLQWANLQGANLQGANLQGANLQDSNLQGANLQDSNLQDSDLQDSDLQWADLQGANLQRANLQGANLQGANNWQNTEWANQCKRDILFILQNLKSEVPALRFALIEWKVDWSQYEWECACLVGTLGKSKGLDKTCEMIPFYTKGLHNFGEQFFWQIRKWDTPENSEFSKVAVELCDIILNK